MTTRAERRRLRQEALERGQQERPKTDEKNKDNDDFRPSPNLTPKRLRFAMLWAEADPEDSLGDIARRAGYSEGTATGGWLAEVRRDKDVLAARDWRLRELQQASRVTVEDTLLGLRLIARDPKAPMRDRVAALKTILAWYAKDKGQHAPEQKVNVGLDTQLGQALERYLGIPIDEKNEPGS